MKPGLKKSFALLFLPLLLNASCTAILVETTGGEGMREDVTERSVGGVITDETIETRIRVNLASEEGVLGDANIDVTAHRGIVLLVGQVPSPELKQRAVEIASESSTQIRRIHDELEVTGNTSLLTRGNDALISTRVRALLLTNESISDANIRVVTENSAVYLLGVVSREHGDRAAALVSDVGGVTRVVKVFEYIN